MAPPRGRPADPAHSQRFLLPPTPNAAIDDGGPKPLPSPTQPSGPGAGRNAAPVGDCGARLPVAASRAGEHFQDLDDQQAQPSRQVHRRYKYGRMPGGLQYCSDVGLPLLGPAVLPRRRDRGSVPRESLGGRTTREASVRAREAAHRGAWQATRLRGMPFARPAAWPSSVMLLARRVGTPSSQRRPVTAGRSAGRLPPWDCAGAHRGWSVAGAGGGSVDFFYGSRGTDEESDTQRQTILDLATGGWKTRRQLVSNANGFIARGTKPCHSHHPQQ
jgi:hypothetical protein